MTRRGALAKLGGFGAAVLAVAGWKAVASESASEAPTAGVRPAGSGAAGSGPAGVASGAVSCVLTPEQTEGPYYLAGEPLRRNVTGGRPGTPLTLRLKVVDASTCRPIKGALVDVWHCDAGGVYSGFREGVRSRTFMRGRQRTDRKGIATFTTVYPGWYPGRTVHIHVKVHLGGNVVHTGQLYFPDALTDVVYRRAPYKKRRGRTTRSATDAVYRNGGTRSRLRLRKVKRGYLGRITMGVLRT
jgi:protocatechuate 3,4-dioxygenase beta subunit